MKSKLSKNVPLLKGKARGGGRGLFALLNKCGEVNSLNVTASWNTATSLRLIVCATLINTGMYFNAINGSGPAAFLSEVLHVYTPSRTLRSPSYNCMLKIQQYTHTHVTLCGDGTLESNTCWLNSISSYFDLRSSYDVKNRLVNY